MDLSAVWSTCIGVPGLSRSECASWIQAWGSIGAVLIAVWVSARQSRHALDLEERRSRAANIERLSSVLALLANAEGILKALKATFEANGARGASPNDLSFLQDSADRFRDMRPMEIGNANVVAQIVVLPRAFTMLYEAWAGAKEEEYQLQRHDADVEELERNPSSGAYGGSTPDPGDRKRKKLTATLEDVQFVVASSILESRKALDAAGWYGR